MEHLNLFEKNGGKFPTGKNELQKKMKNIRAFLFDWDGVFNDSRKTGKGDSYFTEVESMGLNMLRFSNYLSRGRELAYMSVMSGEENDSARIFLAREHFDHCYFKAKDKKFALEDLKKRTGLKDHEIAFVFDDILDLSVAKLAGVRICVHRKANPLFLQYVMKNELADYITGSECGNFALRESCELMIGLYENYDEVVTERISYSKEYLSYLKTRDERETVFISAKNNLIQELS